MRKARTRLTPSLPRITSDGAVKLLVERMVPGCFLPPTKISSTKSVFFPPRTISEGLD